MKKYEILLSKSEIEKLNLTVDITTNELTLVYLTDSEIEQYYEYAINNNDNKLALKLIKNYKGSNILPLQISEL